MNSFHPDELTPAPASYAQTTSAGGDLSSENFLNSFHPDEVTPGAGEAMHNPPPPAEVNNVAEILKFTSSRRNNSGAGEATHNPPPPADVNSSR